MMLARCPYTNHSSTGPYVAFLQWIVVTYVLDQVAMLASLHGIANE